MRTPTTRRQAASPAPRQRPLPGCRAKVRSIYKMVMKIGGESPTYMEACGYYNDIVVRTADGWRIADRFEQILYIR
jgi:hypothetical protein